MQRLLQALGIAATLFAALTTVSVRAATSTAGGPVTVTIAGPDQGSVGQSLSLLLTVTNPSATTALTSVTLGASFPQSAKLVAPLPNPDLCGRAGSGGTTMGFSCFIGTLAPGAAASIPFGLQPGVAGTLTVQAGGSGFLAGVFTSSSTSLSIPIAPAPTDVQVSGSASTGSPSAGASFSYTFQVKNGGNQPAYGVSFSDTLPAGETLTAVNANNFAPCTVSGNTASCSLGDIAVGGQVLVVINALASTTPATYADTASAWPTNGDVQPSNNSVNVTMQVK